MSKPKAGTKVDLLPKTTKSAPRRRTQRSTQNARPNPDIPVPQLIQEGKPPLSGRLPRGLIIFSEAQDNIHKFHKGFKYPGEILSAYQISKKDWSDFCNAIAAPLGRYKGLYPGIGDGLFPGIYDMKTNKGNYLHIRRAIDDTLDIVTKWDRIFFRPRGLVMRMDMPGEAKYGLTFMDFFHKGHIDNCSGVLTRRVMNYEDKKHHKLDKKDKHLSRMLERGYCSTRIVLDEIGVLENDQVSEERGWTEWTRFTNHARSVPPVPVLDKAKRREMGKPFDDRWPHSKHIYYERYRGEAVSVGSGYGRNRRFIWVWRPSYDSLDQRNGEWMLATRAVLPADGELPAEIKRDFLVYWDKWAMELLYRDGYYGATANDPAPCFAKRKFSAIPQTSIWVHGLVIREWFQQVSRNQWSSSFSVY
jgi:hypothetical protein